MKKNYSVFRIEKRKSVPAIKATEGHNRREPGHIEPNHDPKRRGLNRTLIDPGPDPVAKWGEIVGDNGGCKVRSNAVRTCECLLTFSPGAVVPLEEWVEASVGFLKQEFGEKNVLSAYLHLDERTPHIQAQIVPMLEGRLCARELFNGRKMMSELQDRAFAACGEPFGLDRGEVDSGSRHVGTREYLGTVSRVVDRGEKIVEQSIQAFSDSLGFIVTPKAKETAVNELKQSLNPVFAAHAEALLRADDAEAREAKAEKRAKDKLEAKDRELESKKRELQSMQAELDELRGRDVLNVHWSKLEKLVELAKANDPSRKDNRPPHSPQAHSQPDQPDSLLPFSKDFKVKEKEREK